jgi:lipopolysaccharide export system protein LptC
MKWFPDRQRAMVLVLIVGLGALAVSMAQEPMVDLRIPLEHYLDGVLKTELSAARAEVGRDGRIRGYGIVVKCFAEDGSLEMEIQAEDCVLDRVKERAASTKHASLTRGGINVSGDGFRWNGTDEKLRILKNARVVIPSAMVREKRVLERVRKK